MTYTYNKLRGRIIELYGSQGKFSNKLGISKNSVSKKMSCKSGFSQSDIVKWSLLLNIDVDDYGKYFFT